MVKRVSPPFSLSELCESALNELENNHLEEPQTVNVREIEAGKSREELYSRLKEQLASLGQAGKATNQPPPIDPPAKEST